MRVAALKDLIAKRQALLSTGEKPRARRGVRGVIEASGPSSPRASRHARRLRTTQVGKEDSQCIVPAHDQRAPAPLRTLMPPPGVGGARHT